MVHFLITLTIDVAIRTFLRPDYTKLDFNSATS